MILSPAPAAPLSWFLGLGAIAAYALAAFTRGRVPAAALVVGWLLHGVALVIDIGGLDASAHGARFGFAPVLSVTVWLVLAVHQVESRFVPLPGTRRALAVAGAVVVLLAAVFPGDIRPLTESAWMPLHWVLGVGSFGLFGAAVLHAAMLDSAERKMRLKTAIAPSPLGMPLLRLEKLTFRFVDAGFIVLSAALVLGVYTAMHSAAGWRWDHKTVFSLLGWATFAALIVGRHVAGWRGRRATRWLYAGAGLLTLGYVGSRFVLEVVLHRPPV